MLSDLKRFVIDFVDALDTQKLEHYIYTQNIYIYNYINICLYNLYMEYECKRSSEQRAALPAFDDRCRIVQVF